MMKKIINICLTYTFISIAGAQTLPYSIYLKFLFKIHATYIGSWRRFRRPRKNQYQAIILCPAKRNKIVFASRKHKQISAIWLFFNWPCSEPSSAWQISESWENPLGSFRFKFKSKWFWLHPPGNINDNRRPWKPGFGIAPGDPAFKYGWRIFLCKWICTGKKKKSNSCYPGHSVSF